MKGKRTIKIDAQGLNYQLLNEKIHRVIYKGYRKIILENVSGQRYIGDGLTGEDIEIVINGVPGNDLAAFMNGPKIVVNGNAQDAVGNTMNSGCIIIYGDAGDIVGYSMRAGTIYIKGDVGYRVGIHMKAYKNLFPVVIVGGTARDFLGEYMAGGLLVILGITGQKNLVGDFVGTGMHGGNIFIRGEVDEKCLGKEVKIAKPTEDDLMLLKRYISDFCKYFNIGGGPTGGDTANYIFKKPFIKLYPYTHRPYGRLYAY